MRGYGRADRGCQSADCFGHCGEGFLRLSYANSMENINKALDRIDVAVRKIERKPAHS